MQVQTPEEEQGSFSPFHFRAKTISKPRDFRPDTSIELGLENESDSGETFSIFVQRNHTTHALKDLVLKFYFWDSSPRGHPLLMSLKFEDFLAPSPLCHTKMAALLRPSYMMSQKLQHPALLA